MIRVFIGTDRSQLLATKVLSHSLKTTTSCPIKIEPLDKINIPEPHDVRQSQRTGFSFARWAIPELCNYQGKAIYLDADMLVFSDINKLWNVSLKDAVIAIVEEKNLRYCANNVKLNKNETSVMLINCEKAKWSLQNLVNGLDGEYTYKEMMSDLCFLEESTINRSLARTWNSMDYWDENVNLIHFTNTPTQPWVSLDNPFGYIWVNYLKSMIESGIISFEEVENEINLGYIRPSLSQELKGKTATLSDSIYLQKLKKSDIQSGYVPHRDVLKWNILRNKAIQEYERTIAKNKGFKDYLLFELKIIKNRILNPIKLRYGKYSKRLGKAARGFF